MNLIKTYYRFAKYFAIIPFMAVAICCLLSAGSSYAYNNGHFRNEIKTNIGFASAVGNYGLTWSFLPRDFFEIEAGAGYGLSGIQFSLMPKFRTGTRSHKYVFGAGLALAVPTKLETQLVLFGDTVKFTTNSLWLNVDCGGYSFRHSSGFTLLAAVGIAVPVAGGKYLHDELFQPHESEDSVLGEIFLQARFGIGFSF